MRVINSKRNKTTGENYHYCPKTQNVAHKEDCQRCVAEGASIEELQATYRVSCPAGEVVKAIEPMHVEDDVPESWGFQTKFDVPQYSVIEPKLDGARCILKVVPTGIEAYSRRNNRFGDQSSFTENIPHISGLKLFELLGDTILDSEIIVQALGASSTGNIPTGTLAATMSVVGSDPPVAVETQRLNGKAHCWIFDVCRRKGVDYTDKPFYIRRAELENLMESLPTDAAEFLHIMPSFKTSTPEQRRELYKGFIQQGAEGAVLIDPTADYYTLRARLKQKEDVTLDVLVTGWEHGKKGGKHENHIGALLCSVKNAETGQLQEVCKVIPGDDATRDRLSKQLIPIAVEAIKEQKIIIWLQAQSWTKEYRLRHPRILEYCKDRDVPSTINFSTVERK